MLSLQFVADFCLCSSSVALPLVTRELPVASHHDGARLGIL